MKRSQVPKQAPLLEDRAFVAVVSNVPVPQLAPLGTIIPSWLIAGIVVDASGLFFKILASPTATRSFLRLMTDS
jgi:hypothetical protein